MPWTTALDSSLQKNYENLQNWFFLKTLLLSISHNVDKNYQNRTSPKIVSTVSTAKIYLYHSSKNTSSRPPLGMSSKYNSVQSFSGSWLKDTSQRQPSRDHREELCWTYGLGSTDYCTPDIGIKPPFHQVFMISRLDFVNCIVTQYSLLG